MTCVWPNPQQYCALTTHNLPEGCKMALEFRVRLSAFLCVYDVQAFRRPLRDPRAHLLPLQFTSTSEKWRDLSSLADSFQVLHRFFWIIMCSLHGFLHILFFEYQSSCNTVWLLFKYRLNIAFSCLSFYVSHPPACRLSVSLVCSKIWVMPHDAVSHFKHTVRLQKIPGIRICAGRAMCLRNPLYCSEI